MREKHAKKLLNKTTSDYNLIASHFSSTRTHPWREFELLLKYITPEDKVLDLGCGNGRFYELLRERMVDYVGVDSSEQLIQIAKQKYPDLEFRVTDALDLPFADDSFDKVVSVAVLHHIPSKKYRQKFMAEAGRVLKKGGILIITVWDLWKKKKIKKMIFKYGLLKLFGLTKLDFKDILYPWKNSKGEVVTKRYFHCFKPEELKNLAENSGFKIKEIREIGKSPRSNILLVAEKK